MVIGDYFQAPQIWTSQTLIHRGSVGYDGQFYYYIAHDPFILGQSYNHIDFPAYRYQRIIYPLTAWLLSFGQPKVDPLYDGGGESHWGSYSGLILSFSYSNIMGVVPGTACFMPPFGVFYFAFCAACRNR